MKKKFIIRKKFICLIILIFVVGALAICIHSLHLGAKSRCPDNCISRIERIATEFSVYYNDHNAIPGMLPDGTVKSSKDIYNALMADNYTKEKTFKVDFKGKKAYWNFIGCEQSDEGRKLSAIDNRTNICIYSSRVHPKNTPDFDKMSADELLKNMNYDAKMVCMIDTMLDDSNEYTGDGRKIADAGENWNDGGKFDNITWDCKNKDNFTGKNLKYAFRIL